MIKTCRLSIGYAKLPQSIVDELTAARLDSNNMQTVLQTAMQKCGVTMQDIEVVGHGDGYGDKTHYGNWVLVPVLHNAKAELLAAQLGTKLDIFENILEQADLNALQVGDKVALNFLSELCFPVAEFGTVLRFNADKTEVTILKKGSRSKGWQKRVNDRCTLTKLDKFPSKQAIAQRVFA